MYKKTLISLILIIICLSNSLVFATDSITVWKDNYEAKIKESIQVNAELTGNFLNLESGAGILIEANSGQILYEHNIHEQLRPASVTKVMSLLLIMESLDGGKIKLDDKVSCSERARKMGGSQIWLSENEELSVHEMLKAIAVVSANDCTVAMAEYLYGSEEIFVSEMNKKAKILGMNDTTFKNSHGIDEDGHVSSAHDIAIMSKELLTKHPKITEYTTIWMDTLRDGKSQLVNTNKLVRNYAGCTGLKTGSTSLALFNLSTSATRDGLSIIAVIMKGPTSDVRFNEAKKLLDYGFSNFGYKEMAKEGEIIKTVSVIKGINKEVNAVYETTKGALVKKGEEKSIVQNMNVVDNVMAPLKKGDKLGEVSYIANGIEIAKVNIVAGEEVKKLSIGNMIAFTYNHWFRLLR